MVLGAKELSNISRITLSVGECPVVTEFEWVTDMETRKKVAYNI